MVNVGLTPRPGGGGSGRFLTNMRCCLVFAQPPADAALVHCGADAALVDLSHPGELSAVLALLRLARGAAARPLLYVKLPPPGDSRFAAALEALRAAPPDGVLLAGAQGGDSVQQLGARLAVFEAEAGLEDGATRIVAEISTPAGVLALESFAQCSRRLAALAFDGAALATRLGVAADAAPVRHARAKIVLAGAAAGLPVLDGVCRAPNALRAECLEARDDGFAGKFAARPEEVATILEAFGAARAEKTPQSAGYLRA